MSGVTESTSSAPVIVLEEPESSESPEPVSQPEPVSSGEAVSTAAEPEQEAEPANAQPEEAEQPQAEPAQADTAETPQSLAYPVGSEVSQAFSGDNPRLFRNDGGLACAQRRGPARPDGRNGVGGV